MQFNKLSFKALILTLAGITSLMAAGMAPLTFSNANTDVDNWNYLLNYKMWGQTGVSFNNRCSFINENGWVGTASGDLSSTGDDAKIGGAVIVGGSIRNTNRMELTTGPVRYGGSISDASRVSGTKCQGTTTAGDCADVPLYREKLTVPKMTSWPSSMGSINASNRSSVEIDAKTQSDFYYNSISLGDEGKLIVKMPAGGRVTRIFTKSLSLGVHPEILVQYEGERLPRCSQSSSTCSGEYEGNLLIYVEDNIYFRNADNSTIEGTIISTETITVDCNIVFAGQLIANKIVIGREIKDDGFQFVPFNELPALTLSNKNATFLENDTWQTIKIGLDKESETDVTFKYCFRFNDQAVSGFYASTSDVAPADATHDFPVCGTSGAPLTATIPKGQIYPSKDINIKPLIDGLVETSTSGSEKLWLVISDVNGANISMDNYDESQGGFNIFITDADKLPTVTKELVINVNEDAGHTFTETEFNFSHATQTFTSVIISGLPTAGTLTYNGTDVSRDQVIDVADLGKLAYQPKANDFGDNYATFKYKVVGSGTSDNTSNEYTATVNVAPVNDKPTVADVTFTVGDRSHSVSGGPIEVTDVSNEIGVDTYTYTLDATSADYSAFNSTFEILPSSNGKKARIAVKTGAVIDYSQKKEYVVQATVTDNASTETSKVAGSLTSNKFTITVKIEEEPETISPLTFGNANTDVDNWNYLVNYKMWGQTGVSFNNRCSFINENGWVGTASGDLSSTGDDAKIGGAVIVGGSIRNTNRMELTTGPVRYGGSISDASRVSGTKCQGTTTAGNCADVPLYREKLTVPKMTSWPSNLSNLTTPDKGTYRLDAQGEVTDFYFNKINVNNDSRLIILMPAGGRVTRIFTKSLTLGVHPEILVQYEGERLPRCSQSSSTCSGEYEGNLLIFVDDDIAFRNADNSTIEGTIISTETITVDCNIVFAGQLIANKIVIGREIKDDGFQFVPLNDGSNTPDPELPTVTKELVINVNEDAGHAFTEAEFNFSHATQTFTSVIISGLPTAGTLTYNGTDVSRDQVIDVANLGKLAYQPKANDFGDNYATFKYKVVGSGTSDNTSIEYTATVNVVPVNDKPTVANATFTVNEQDHSVNGGPIEVTDVSNERSKDTYTYTLVNVTGSDYTDFNSTFEIVKQSDQNATIKVKSGAVIDYIQKKEYVVYATVKDNASTETSVVEGPLTSEQFKITVKIQNENDNPVINDQTFTIAEKNTDGTDWPGGKTVGNVTASDPDGDELSFTVVTTDVPFKFNNNTKELVVTDGSVLDFETKTAWTFTVKVEDGQGGNATAQITVNIEDVQEPEIYVNNEGATVISGNASAGTVIENVTENNDEDTQAQLNEITSAIAYAVSEGTTANATEYFDIDEHGTITAKEELVFEALYTGEDNPGNEFTFVITASGTNSKNEPVSTNITKKIIVADVNEEPVIKTEEPIDVPETALSNGEVVGKIDAIDPDSCSFNPNYACREGSHPQGFNKLTYTIDEILEVDGSTDFPFEIDPNTGVITFRQGPSLIRQYRYNYNTAIVRRVNEPNNTRQRRYEFIVKVTDGSTDPKNPPKSVKKKIVLNITETAHILSSSSGNTTSSSSEVSSSSAIVSSSSSAETITSSGSNKPASSSATVASSSSNKPVSSSATVVSSSANKPESSSATVVSSSANKPESSSATVASCSSNKPVSSSATVASSSANKPESSSATVASSSSNKPESSSATVVSSSANKPASSSATVTSSGSNKPESSSATVTSSGSVKPESSSATVASSGSVKPKSSSAKASSSESSKPESSSDKKTTSSSSASRNDVSSSSNKEVKSSSSIIVSSNSAGKKSSSSVSKPNSSSSGVSPNSSSSRKTSSSSKTQSSCSSKETGTDKSSSSHKPNSSASSSNSNNDGYDTPTFYVRMTGAFEFEIVMDESLPSIAKQYAVMDMKGQVICIGELNNKNTHVKVPTSGAYIVRIGLGYRRVNVR